MEQNQEQQKMSEKKDINITNFFGDNVVASSIIVSCLVICAVMVFSSFIIAKGGWNFGSSGTTTITAPAAQAAATGTGALVKVTDRAGEPSIGNPNAKVTIYEFGDFQCPYCKAFFQQSYADIKTKYIDTGEVRLVFRDFPLTQIHVNAEISSEAAECANEQGQFEAYYESLYTNGQGDGTDLDEASLKKYASQIGLNMTTFDNCLDTHATASIVAADEALGTSLGVNGTPTFFINGVTIQGAQPTATFDQTIDAALKTAK